MKAELRKINEEYLRNASETLETYLLSNGSETVFYILVNNGQWILFKSLSLFADYWYAQRPRDGSIGLTEEQYNDDEFLINLMTEKPKKNKGQINSDIVDSAFDIFEALKIARDELRDAGNVIKSIDEYNNWREYYPDVYDALLKINSLIKKIEEN